MGGINSRHIRSPAFWPPFLLSPPRPPQPIHSSTEAATTKMSDPKHTITHADDEKDAVRHLDHTSSDDGATQQPGTLGKIGDIAISAHMTPEEKAAAIRLANEADPGPSVGSWRYFKFLVTAFLVILNSGDSGESHPHADHLSVVVLA